MKPEFRREATEAARLHLATTLRGVTLTTRTLEEAARVGEKSELLHALENWDAAIAQAQEARQKCEALLGDEVEAWLQN